MFRAFFAFVMALATPVVTSACEPVLSLVAPQAVYAAPAQFVAPVTYQAQVLAVAVNDYCAVPQQIVVQKQVVQQVVRQKVVRERVVVRQPRVVRQRVVVRHH